ncbi:DNA polymerase III subunit gamma/tau [Brevibacillus laterosporus]|uniref:DNA polymerase III subunit gamma/tau n=1 Tax=Brevibacillus laterosporus TaxID=1465 RepID=A0A502HBR1_BRELA|nr:DNA polymerase III subunit gamma/tau [Brevibacillus laterosporus]QDX95810.1 DNA polymerase III subunit gamma/tau [Brevibacillus laterosporus]TPG71454.1 DNA polymerase III subunit gamma/tau [Brevibacillus laterosporus]TPG83719.1 DNA polymerase III subunit gamma/tau [Brevibacillus laterosporus]
MSDRNFVIPKNNEMTSEQAIQKEVASQVEEQQAIPATEEATAKVLSEEEASIREKVFFEEDEKVRLRDGKTYSIPPLGIKDARKLMKLLNTIDSGIIIANLIPESEVDDDRYEELLKVLLMAFKPYYKHVDTEYLADYVDLETGKKIIDAMIGLNGLKKSM